MAQQLPAGERRVLEPVVDASEGLSSRTPSPPGSASSTMPMRVAPVSEAGPASHSASRTAYVPVLAPVSHAVLDQAAGVRAATDEQALRSAPIEPTRPAPRHPTSGILVLLLAMFASRMLPTRLWRRTTADSLPA
jgi:hypothetical protein